MTEKKEKKISVVWFVLALIGVVILWLINLNLASKLPAMNEKGDAFGLVNSLFSGLAFAGLVFSIILQRQELALTRKELRESKDEFKMQNATLKLQQFENTFFNMMKVLENNLTNLRFQAGPNIYTGNYYFKFVAGLLNNSFTRPGMQSIEKINAQILLLNINENKKYSEIEIYSHEIPIEIHEHPCFNLLANELYSVYYNTHRVNLNQLFLYLCNILEFVKKSDSEIEKKQFYFNLIKAQLSDGLLALIFYHGLSFSSLNREKRYYFKELIDEIQLLENLENEFVSVSFLPRLYYPKTDFKHFPSEQ